MSSVSPATRESRDSRLDGIKLVGAMAALMWVVEIIDSLDGHGLDRYGIEPRKVDGLLGILTAPFLHANFGHLIGNFVPFVLMGFAVALNGAARVLAVTAIIAVVGGFGTWLIAPAHTVHIGASGIVFGYASYLIVRGVFDRSVLELALGVVVVAVWGATLLSSLVPHDGISWQGHLFGGVGGVVAAAMLARGRRGEAPAPSTA